MSAQPQKQSVTVRIAGEEHTIRANAAPEYTRACAEYVDTRINEVRGRGGLIEGHRAAILAALSIVDEYFRAREALEGAEQEMEERIDRLIQTIERAETGEE